LPGNLQQPKGKGNPVAPPQQMMLANAPHW
jgi:hypothetical protein